MSQAWRTLAAALLTAIIGVAVLLLMLGGTLRLTLFSSDWYQQAFSHDIYIKSLHEAISDDLSEQGAYVGVPAEVLQQGLADEKLYVMLRAYFQNTSDFLNRRSAAVEPEYPVSLFQVPLMSFAREQARQGGLALSAEQERLLGEIARDSAGIVRKRVALVNVTALQQAAWFQKAHQAVYFLSQVPLLSAMVLLTALVLLMLVRRPFRRFLSQAMVGVWLAGALLAVPLAVQECFGLVRRLSVTPDYLKFALDRLLTSATRSLLTWSAATFILATVTLLILFFLEERLSAKEARRQRKLVRRSKRQAAAMAVSQED